MRTYAAAAQQDVKPPIAVYGLDGTYATALVRPPCPPMPRGSIGPLAALREAIGPVEAPNGSMSERSDSPQMLTR